jgi:hypothetical protein
MERKDKFDLHVKLDNRRANVFRLLQQGSGRAKAAPW